MPQFCFVGNLNIFNQRQLDFISEVLKTKGFEGSAVFIENVGDGFIANVKRLLVKENGKTLRIIAKIAPKDVVFRELTSTHVLFMNEHVMYTQLLPKFAMMQKKRGLEDVFRYVSHYGSFLERNYEVILLEDLEEERYELLDRAKPLSNELVKLVLDNFALFHSLSFVLRHQEPDMYKTIKSKLVEPLKDSESVRKYFCSLENAVIKSLDDKYKSVVKGKVLNNFAALKEITEKVTDSPYIVISHGDGWTNNLMFKVEASGPVKCALIDYQMTTEQSPVFDVMYLIFSCTSHEQRMAHYQDFINHYYSQLDRSLANYGMRASNVYPRNQLNADMKEYANWILIKSIHVSFFIVKKDGNTKMDGPEILNDGNTEMDAPEILDYGNREMDAPEILDDGNTEMDAPEILDYGNREMDAPEILDDGNTDMDAPEILDDGNTVEGAPEILDDGNTEMDAPEILDDDASKAALHILDSESQVLYKSKIEGIVDSLLGLGLL